MARAYLNLDLTDNDDRGPVYVPKKASDKLRLLSVLMNRPLCDLAEEAVEKFAEPYADVIEAVKKAAIKTREKT